MEKSKNNSTHGTQKNSGREDPINKPHEVEQSKDEKIDQDFPGYPHYPAKDDILRKGNNNGEVDMDVEDLSRSNKETVARQKLNQPVNASTENDNAAEVDESETADSVNDADVTAEDLNILGPRDADMDMGEDEELGITGKANLTGEELDVPGSELDDNNEEIGEEDEENNYYSLGGDNHESLEEDPTTK